MGKMTPAKFPIYVHVTREKVGTEDEYLSISSSQTAQGALTSTEIQRVATYKLVEIQEGRIEGVFRSKVVE